MRRDWTERTEDYKDYSDYGESASGLSVDKKSLTDKEPIWHETGASTFFENGENMTLQCIGGVISRHISLKTFYLI